VLREPLLLASWAVGVAHAATCMPRSVRLTPHRPSSFRLRSRNFSRGPPACDAVGVAHAVAAEGIEDPPFVCNLAPLPSRLVGVGHEEEAVALVRRAEACSRQIGGPDCIAELLQVSSNSGEPSVSVSACNLLSKERCRASDGQVRPQSRP